jgi:NAD(P)-dependent dehydrogenase (short-subunit alcohol dehydrogenase family)
MHQGGTDRVAGTADRVVPVALDVTDASSVSALAGRLTDVDVLINNAGISRGQALLDTAGSDAADDEMRVNYFGTLATIRAFALILSKNGGGAIVNILSISRA